MRTGDGRYIGIYQRATDDSPVGAVVDGIAHRSDDLRRALGSGCDKMKWRNDLSPGIRAGDGYVGEGGDCADEQHQEKQGEVLHGFLPVKD
jgi:hypothetical protein